MGTQRKRSAQPTVSQLKSELSRVRYKQRYGSVLRSTLSTLLISAACAVLIATVFLPILQIYGTSMTPTLVEGDIVVSVKGADLVTGDLISFYVGNKLLVKRYIAGPGQWVNIDEAGNVYVDNELINEPYVSEKALGDCNIDLPYQVPESRYFVLGDHRISSVDSRNTSVGCVGEDQIVGKIVFRLWPISRCGRVE